MKIKYLGSITFILLLIGLIFISVSSISEAAYTAGDKLYFIKRQLLWSIVGIVCYFIATKINLGLIKKSANPLFFGSISLLLIVLLPQFSHLTLGAKRWLDLGFIGIQPSEIVKLSSIIFFAKLFSDSANVSIKKLLLFLSLPLTLIILEPNFSTSILIAAIVITTYYIAGGEIVPLFSLCSLGLALSVLLIFSSPYRKARLDSLSYHSNQMILTITSGHLIGKGFANSDQKYRYLPKISTDSILAVIGEETGFIGVSLIVSLYLFLFLTIVKIGQNSSDRFFQLLVFGVGCQVAYQSLINISAVVSLIPLTGVPLPLISYGGSSLITILFGLGLVQNINQHSTNLLYSDRRENNQNHHHRRHPPHSRHRVN